MANATSLTFEKYTLLKDAYAGTGGFLNGNYIVQHKRELEENYTIRKSVAYYLNYLQPVVNSHVNPIFRRTPARNWEGKESATQDGTEGVATGKPATPTKNSYWDAYVKDVDINGSTLDAFMKRAALSAKLNGVVFLVTDNMAQTPKTQAEAIKNRQFPYTYVVTPDRVTNTQTDRYGRLVAVTYSEQVEEVVNTGKDNDLQYRTWTETEWFISDKDGNKIGEGAPHNLGLLPVVPLYSRIPPTGIVIPDSEFLAIARVNARLYNLCSELDEILRNQAFSILIYPGTELPKLTVGVNNALGFDGKESRFAPDFIAPPSGPAEWLMKHMDRLIQEIYRMALLTHVTGVKEQRTGASKAWDFEMTNQVLADFAQNCENAELALAKVFAAWTGQALNYTCKYSNDFSVLDVADELDVLQKAANIVKTGKGLKELQKRAISLVLRDIAPDLLKVILEAIDAMSDSGSTVLSNTQTVQDTAGGDGTGTTATSGTITTPIPAGSNSTDNAAAQK